MLPKSSPKYKAAAPIRIADHGHGRSSLSRAACMSPASDFTALDHGLAASRSHGLTAWGPWALEGKGPLGVGSPWARVTASATWSAATRTSRGPGLDPTFFFSPQEQKVQFVNKV